MKLFVFWHIWDLFFYYYFKSTFSFMPSRRLEIKTKHKQTHHINSTYFMKGFTQLNNKEWNYKKQWEILDYSRCFDYFCFNISYRQQYTRYIDKNLWYYTQMISVIFRPYFLLLFYPSFYCFEMQVFLPLCVSCTLQNIEPLGTMFLKKMLLN